MKFTNKNEDGELHVEALKFTLRIAESNNAHKQCLIDARMLPCFRSFIKHSGKVDVKKTAILTVSKVALGTSAQTQALVEAKLLPLLVEAMNINELEVQTSAVLAIVNFTSAASTKQILQFLKQYPVINSLCDLLTVNQPRFVKSLCASLRNILLVVEKASQEKGASVRVMLLDRLPEILLVAEVSRLGANDIYSELRAELPELVRLADLKPVDHLRIDKVLLDGLKNGEKKAEKILVHCSHVRITFFNFLFEFLFACF